MVVEVSGRPRIVAYSQGLARHGRDVGLPL
jgi:hypothetical protein